MKTAPLALSFAVLVLSACDGTGSGNVAFSTWETLVVDWVAEV